MSIGLKPKGFDARMNHAILNGAGGPHALDASAASQNMAVEAIVLGDKAWTRVGGGALHILINISKAFTAINQMVTIEAPVAP